MFLDRFGDQVELLGGSGQFELAAILVLDVEDIAVAGDLDGEVCECFCHDDLLWAIQRAGPVSCPSNPCNVNLSSRARRNDGRSSV